MKATAMSKRLGYHLRLIAPILLIVTISGGQVVDKNLVRYKLAVEEFESVLNRSERIPDPRKFVTVRAKAANLLWVRDPERSRAMFIKLWETIDKQLDDNKAFDKERSRIELLQQLVPKDRTLAAQLISSSRVGKEKVDPVLDNLKGTNVETQRLAFLAYRLAEDDPVLAGAILSDALSTNTSPALPLILNRIREKDVMLANYIASQALDRFPNQSPTIALSGLANVAAYLFPLAPSPNVVPEATGSDENLRQQFMQVGYSALKRSLAETDEDLIKNDGFSDQAMLLRKINRAVIGGILLALSPRYSPAQFVEMNAISISLMQAIPRQFVGLISMQIAAVKALLGGVERSEGLDAEIIAAIVREDFFKADLLISDINDESRKKGWFNVLYRAKAKTQLQRGEPLLALASARKIENVAMAIPILIDIAKAANKKQDESLSTNAFQAILSLTGIMKEGMRAKTMFSVSGEMAYFMQTQSSLILLRSVEVINGLSQIKSEQTKPVSYAGETYWEDPDNFLSSPAMVRAFSVLGELELQETLLIANRFRDNALQMLATLASIEKVLSKGPPKPSPRKPTAKKTNTQ
ncbi:MAG: hypothetical protein IT173_14960 [Acidobacteria bacterium]|nr:hypothetical protein [Acidobacteriota bacterium]